MLKYIRPNGRYNSSRAAVEQIRGSLQDPVIRNPITSPHNAQVCWNTVKHLQVRQRGVESRPPGMRAAAECFYTEECFSS